MVETAGLGASDQLGQLVAADGEPADPTEWVHKRNHYFTQLIWSSASRP